MEKEGDGGTVWVFLQDGEGGEGRPVCLVGKGEGGGRPSKWGVVRWRNL